MTRKALFTLVSAAILILLSFGQAQAGSLNDRQVIKQTENILNLLPNASFKADILKEDGKRNLVVHMKPKGFRTPNQKRLATISVLGLIMACKTAEKGRDIHQVRLSVEGLVDIKLSLFDYRLIRTKKLNKKQIKDKLVFIPK